MNFRIYSTSFVVYFSRGTANLYANLQINLHEEIVRISQLFEQKLVGNKSHRVRAVSSRITTSLVFFVLIAGKELGEKKTD